MTGRWIQLAVLVSLLALLAGCETTGGTLPDDCDLSCECQRNPNYSAACRCLLDPEGDECYCSKDSSYNTLRCLCVRDPGNPACRPCPDASAANQVRAALREASQGNWPVAQTTAECVLEQDPANARATKLLDQIISDARQYFDDRGLSGSNPYTVTRGDTLGTIAGRCLGDSDLFIALARLNRLARPDGIKIGDVIRIPGRRPCRKRDTSTRDGNSGSRLDQVLQAEQGGDLASAWRLVERLYRSDKSVEVTEAFDRIRLSYASELNDQALNLLGSDCPGARKLWEKALRVLPDFEDPKYYLGELPCE